jgi:hypothetical protein
MGQVDRYRYEAFFPIVKIIHEKHDNKRSFNNYAKEPKIFISIIGRRAKACAD